MRLITHVLERCNNMICSRARSPHSLLFYVIESGDWSIKWDGKYITKGLNIQKLLEAKITTTYKGIYNQIIHFGSRGTYFPNTWEKVDSSNKIVFTWFHGMEKDRNPANLALIKTLPEASKRANLVHTSCTISKENLIRWGVPPDKIVVVPLGVDLGIFKPVSEGQKDTIRKELGLPQDKVIIGSFQKDGVGWGKGLEPKWVKGPDIFIEVIDNIKSDYDIFVLLTGPARGYVKKELARIGVPYKHFFIKDYLAIPKYYNALDLYLVTSRAEGGPKAIAEAIAAGIPLVSTKVGMAPDIVKDDYNGLLAEIEDVEALSEQTRRIIEDKELANQLVNNALNTVANYSWENITKEYYERIYKRLLNM
ncbi:glycosyltransferase family 4 protein [Chloroflexota bacterium]